jgi:prepilin-type N-terminal cleavage/methylation domain-containing protein
MNRRSDSSPGFSLIELAIVLTVIGLLLSFGIPAYKSLSGDQQLRGASESIAGQITLTRVRAMATGSTQTINFDTSTNPPRIVVLSGTSSRTWTLPRGITFVSGNANSFNMTSDGRASTSQYVVVANRKGRQDTVSVQVSGLVLVR